MLLLAVGSCREKGPVEIWTNWILGGGETSNDNVL